MWEVVDGRADAREPFPGFRGCANASVGAWEPWAGFWCSCALAGVPSGGVCLEGLPRCLVWSPLQTRGLGWLQKAQSGVSVLVGAFLFLSCRPERCGSGSTAHPCLEKGRCVGEDAGGAGTQRSFSLVTVRVGSDLCSLRPRGELALEQTVAVPGSCSDPRPCCPVTHELEM